MKKSLIIIGESVHASIPKHGKVMKEFGEGNGVLYVDRPEDVVAKAIELVQNSSVEKLGAKARSFVERYNWDTITDEFQNILEEAIKKKQK